MRPKLIDADDEDSSSQLSPSDQPTEIQDGGPYSVSVHISRGNTRLSLGPSRPQSQASAWVVSALQTKELQELITAQVTLHQGAGLEDIVAEAFGSDKSSSSSSSVVSSCGKADKRKYTVVKELVKHLHEWKLSDTQAQRLIELLLPKLSEISLVCLPGLVNSILKALYIQGSVGKALELFPKAFSILISQNEPIDCKILDLEPMSVGDYHVYVIKKITQTRWCKTVVMAVLMMIKDLPLTETELADLMKKIGSHIVDLELQQLPAFVYQFLLLATQGHKLLVLQNVLQHFDHLDLNSSRELLLVEGTVLLHLSFAAKQDADLAKNLLELLRQSPLTPFCLAVILAVLTIKRMEKKVKEMLLKHIDDYFANLAKRHQSDFLKRAFRENVSFFTDVWEVSVQTVRNSATGWDFLVPSLVNLGFVLLDTKCGRTPLQHYELKADYLETSAHNQVRLGAGILFEVFKAHRMAQTEIMEQCLLRIMANGAGESSAALPAIFLISKLIEFRPNWFVALAPKIKNSLDYLSQLEPDVAISFLRCLSPLFQLHTDLQDYVVLILRKLAFNRDLASRRIAVLGLMALIQKRKLSAGGEPIQFSQSSSHKTERQLFTEVLGILRRTLSQEAEIRSLLYGCLFQVFCEERGLRPLVFDLLLPHFLKFLEPDKDVPLPFNSSAVALNTKGEFFENFPSLLSVVLRCFIISLAQDEPDAYREVLLPNSLQFLQKVLACSLEDCQLSSGDASANHARAVVMSGVLQSCMEYVVRAFESLPGSRGSALDDLGACPQFKTLWTLFRRVQTAVQAKSTKPKKGEKKEGGDGGVKMPKSKKPKTEHDDSKSEGSQGKPKKPTVVATIAAHNGHSSRIFSDEGVVLLLQLSCSDEIVNDNDWQLHIMIACWELMRDLTCYSSSASSTSSSSSSPCLFVEAQTEAKTMTLANEIAPLVFSQFTRHVKSFVAAGGTQISGVTGGSLKKKSLLLIDLELMEMLYRLFAKDPNLLASHGTELSSSCEGASTKKRISIQLQCFEKVLLQLLATENPALAEAGVLMNILTILANALADDESEESKGYMTVHRDFIEKLCVKHQIEDSFAVRVAQYSMLFWRNKTLTRLCGFVRDVRVFCGNIGGAQEESEANYGIVNEVTVAEMVSFVTSEMGPAIGEVEWILGQIKLLVAKKTPEDDAEILKYETRAVSRMNSMVCVLLELSTTNLPDSSYGAYIKVLTAGYTMFTNMIKMMLLFKHEATSAFEQLCSSIANHLTKAVYPLLTAKSERMKKQNVLIPRLIFAMEQYEHFVIKLSKVTGIQPAKHLKYSAARDFSVDSKNILDELQTLQEEEGLKLKRKNTKGEKKQKNRDEAESAQEEGEAEHEGDPQH